jgi:hypothetical protein
MKKKHIFTCEVCKKFCFQFFILAHVMFEEVLNVQVASISQTEPDFKII